MKVGDKTKVIFSTSEFIGRVGIITTITNETAKVLFPCGTERIFDKNQLEIVNIVDTTKEINRKHRRSFEEQLRKYLLKLEQNNQDNISKLVLSHLETELHKQMIEYSK